MHKRIDRQTNQRNNLLKQQYRQQLNEQQTREKEIIKTPRKPIEERTFTQACTFTQAVNNATPNLTPANSSSANRLVTRQTMELHTANAVFTAASFILKKLTLDDDQTLKELQQILQGVSHNTTNINSQDPLKTNVNSVGETARTQNAEPEPMEAQTSEIIIIDDAETNLTEITETEITETAEPSSVISVNKSKIENSTKTQAN